MRGFYVKRYKPSYDAFNGFLAKNLSTVSKALSDECLVAGNFLVLAANAGQRIPISGPLFEKIRTRAFNDSLKLAKSFASDPSKHPMIVKSENDFVVDYSNYDYDYKFDETLRSLEDYSRKAIINRISSTIYNKILGGLNNIELQKKRQACDTNN